MRLIYSPSAEARPSVLQQKHSQSWKRFAYQAVLLILFFGILVWMRHNLTNPEIPDWKPVLALADTAQEKGDLYYAKSLYSQAGRIAALGEDWVGLIAAACAMSKLDKQKGRYSPTDALLLRAMIAAETRKSRSGMAAVAKAFTGIGEGNVASMVLSRMQENWIEQANNSANVLSPGCWAN